jgi:hypothetical protein
MFEKVMGGNVSGSFCQRSSVSAASFPETNLCVFGREMGARETFFLFTPDNLKAAYILTNLVIDI